MGVVILGIDPGHTESGYALIDDDYRPVHAGKISNELLLERLGTGWFWSPTHTDMSVCIEMVGSYGMPVGAEVFLTCVWIGRFSEQVRHLTGHLPELILRTPVRLHHCRSSKAKDSNVVQALVDRFAYGQPNYGKGTKANPGWFFGFRADMWQAYACAVYAQDMQREAAAA